MEEDKYRLACHTRGILRPDVQRQTILVLGVAQMRGELIVDLEAIAGEVREGGDRWDASRAVTVFDID